MRTGPSLTSCLNKVSSVPDNIMLSTVTILLNGIRTLQTIPARKPINLELISKLIDIINGNICSHFDRVVF